MYHRIDEHEKHPENYVLKEIEPSMLEDECFDFLSKPRQTQRTIGLYLQKKKGSETSSVQETSDEGCPKTKFSLQPGDRTLEKNVKMNKGFWVGRPEKVAPITYKLRENFTVDIPKKTREQGVFYRAKFLEMDYMIERAKAGLLPVEDEESSESEEEVQKVEEPCPELNKQKQTTRICDPCKEEKAKKEKVEEEPPKDLIEELRRKGINTPFKKIPSGCQCDYFGDHNVRPTVWDSPFEDRLDMLRQHEMNKVLRPFKQELLLSNYKKNPPVKFLAHEPGMKRTFPVFQISNL